MVPNLFSVTVSKLKPLWRCWSLPVLASIFFLQIDASAKGAEEFHLVQNGQAEAVIVADIPANPKPQQVEGIQKACQLLQMAVERSTGVKLDILSAQEAENYRGKKNIILIGSGALSQKAEIENKPLPAEGWRIVAQPKVCAFIGNLEVNKAKFRYYGQTIPTAYFAVAEVIENHWKGRWLWPGSEGFFIPKQADLSIPIMDEISQPKLEMRYFSMNPLNMKKRGKVRAKVKSVVDTSHDAGIDEAVATKAQDELDDWLNFHRFGSRLKRGSQHSFQDWWEKYHEAHPDYFALPIANMSQPWPQATRVKLRLGNPMVSKQILTEWREAGKPDVWGIGPNDGAGFDTSPETMAMDVPLHQEPEKIWFGDANLSARYARFWSEIIQQMRKENPQIRLSTLIYSAYRNAPPKDVDLKGLVGAFVHGWTPEARESWKGWRENGVEMYLRPNWTHIGGGAPYMNPYGMGDFVRWTIQNGSIGTYFDSMHGNWANQGVTYYVLARVSENPELTVEQILDEYATAFGAAKPAILEYLKYWTDYSEKCAYPVSAGGAISINPEGLYEKAAKEHGFSMNPLMGSHPALPYLYPDEIIAPAREILAEAAKAVAGEDAEYQARVRFLQLGLDHLVLNRDAVALGLQVRENPSSETVRKAYKQKVAELHAFRAKVTPLHVVSAEAANGTDLKRGSPAAGIKKKTQEESEDERGL